MPRESMQFDVVIVGAGPAGLSTACRLKQLNASLTVCVIDKAAQIGSHILSGAVLDPSSLRQLLPNLDELDHPLKTPVTQDKFLLLTQKSAWRLPTPPQMHNQGNFIISLGELCRFLAQQAEALGVEIYPGFAATETIIEEDVVKGIITGDMGVNHDGSQSANYQPGMELRGNITVFAEGCRGSLSEQLMQRFNCRDDAAPQTYGIGIKELWQVDNEHHQTGLVLHSVGWPLDHKTYGGSFMYHLNDNKIAVGFVVGLDYQNPYLDPFQECQRFKTHPYFKHYFKNGERIGYGARALNEGGFQSLPKLTIPGGLFVGCSAGFLNVPKIKGNHNAILSGILAAESIVEHRQDNSAPLNYADKIKASPIWQELYRVRNIRPAFRWGLLPGLCYAAIDTYLLRGKAPWTWNHHSDHSALQPAKNVKPIKYPKPDNVLTFDKLSSVYLSNISHEENQPCHLTLKNPELPISVNYQQYASPESRYCPANVYEIIQQDNEPSLRINSQNCIHCKTCDIKDPKQNIRWIPPQGGSGPNYPEM